MRPKIEAIIRLVNSVLSKPQVESDHIVRIIRVYACLGDLLDPTLHLIIPFLCSSMHRDLPNLTISVRIEIVKFFNGLSYQCPSTVQFLSLIVDAFVSNLCNQGEGRGVSIANSLTVCL